MNAYNKQTHQTIFGGIITIFVVVFFSFSGFLSMWRSDEFYQKDTVSYISKRYGFEVPPDA
jgi:hypothetical protein